MCESEASSREGVKGVMAPFGKFWCGDKITGLRPDLFKPKWIDF